MAVCGQAAVHQWRREGHTMDFILGERLCLVSYADEPRKAGERPTGRHGASHPDH